VKGAGLAADAIVGRDIVEAAAGRSFACRWKPAMRRRRLSSASGGVEGFPIH